MNSIDGECELREWNIERHEEYAEEFCLFCSHLAIRERAVCACLCYRSLDRERGERHAVQRTPHAVK